MILKNLKNIGELIKTAAVKSGRNPADIKLVAVSKRFPPEKITEAYRAGQTIFGENYIQEVQTKRPIIPPGAQIHFIGHLQTNKAKIAAQYCDMVETVDRLKLGKVLNNHLAKLNKSMDILVQVNIGEDPNKAGIPKKEAKELVQQLNELENLRVRGLMTMTPWGKEPEESRVHFRNLRQLAEELSSLDLFTTDNPEISMGMSGDFHIAIEEGATIVRVGTAIFGERAY